VTKPRIDEMLIKHVARRLTERDRDIAQSLYEHRVLTAVQLGELYFDSDVRARHRLGELHAMRVLERFRPFRQTGSHPFHYVLDTIGASTLASERGGDLQSLGWKRTDALAVATSSQLTHLVQTNGFFTALIAAARGRVDVGVVSWWGQRRSGRAWGDLVRPDGYVLLRTPTTDGLGLWLEWDRATEPHARLAEKVDRYQELALALQQTVAAAFVAPGDQRERQILHRLPATPDVEVITTTAARHHADPLGRNWASPNAPGERRSLLELPARPGSSAGPNHPAPTTHTQ
jgi:hypothetical protein